MTDQLCEKAGDVASLVNRLRKCDPSEYLQEEAADQIDTMAAALLKLREENGQLLKALEYYADDSGENWRITDEKGGFVDNWKDFSKRARTAIATSGKGE